MPTNMLTKLTINFQNGTFNTYRSVKWYTHDEENIYFDFSWDGSIYHFPVEKIRSITIEYEVETK